MRLQFRGCAGTPVDPAVVTIAPNNAAISYTDYAGPIVVDATHARITRPIDDGQGYNSLAPGARGRTTVTLLAPGQVIVGLQYTGLVTRTDTYNDVGSVYVDGVYVGDFRCPVAHVAGSLPPVSPASFVLSLTAGAHLVEWVLPYCASVDTTGLLIPATASVSAAPARPAKSYILFGDSRVHGFYASKEIASWAYLLGVLKSARILNMGYGGRQINAGDATFAGGFGCDAAAYLCGYNNFYPGGANITTIQSYYASVIANYRAAVTTAGNPTSKLVMLSDLWSASDIPVGQPGASIYSGNSPTLQAVRNAMAAAVTAAADPYCVFLSGNTGGMPTGLGSFTDGVHPNDAAAVTIAGLVAAVMP